MRAGEGKPSADVSSRRFVRAGLLALVLMVVAHIGDSWVFANVVDPDVYSHDWGRLLRVMGFLPVWLLAACAVLLERGWHDRSAQRAAAFIVLGAGVSGLVGEIAKLLIRRERPLAHAGEYAFRSWSERTFSTGGLAMPSSHVIVAFGAAFALVFVFPRSRWIWFGLAAGCAFTRLLARAHFLSDVVLAGILAWIVVEILARALLPRARA